MQNCFPSKLVATINEERLIIESFEVETELGGASVVEQIAEEEKSDFHVVCIFKVSQFLQVLTIKHHKNCETALF